MSGQLVPIAKDDRQLYARESRTSPVRAGEVLAGGAALAWGGPRLRMLGSAVDRGASFAGRHNFERSAEVLRTAAALRGLLQRGTQAPAQNLRRVRALDAAISRVPAKQRPMVATAAGALLVSNGRPVRRTSYRPVTSTTTGR